MTEDKGTGKPADAVGEESDEDAGADDAALTDGAAAGDGTPPADAAGDDAAEAVADAKPSPAVAASGGKSSKQGGKGQGKGEKKVESKSAASKVAPEPSAASGEADKEPTNEETIAEIFSGAGDETPPGDPRRSDRYNEDLENPHRNDTSPKTFVLTIAAVAVVLGIGFAVLPANLKADAVALLSGEDIIEVRRLREEARVAEERRQRLANAPKFGTVQIVTDPNNLLVTSAGQPAMVFPGTRLDMTYPTRTRVTYQDISVTEDFVFTIDGEGNYENKTYTIPAFGAVDSPWIQSFSGDYTANLTFAVCWPGQPLPVEEKYCLRPVADRAAELMWRRDWRPDPEDTSPDAVVRLLGTITVTSDPPGALIAFNGQQLLNPENGEPYRTPHTFNNYTPPADREDRTPLEVYLSREGLPLQLLYDGKATTRFGVYAHQFTCTPKAGVALPQAVAPDAPADTPPPSWLGVCDYSYAVHVTLVDPKPPEAAGSGEGSGDGSAAPAP